MLNARVRLKNEADAFCKRALTEFHRMGRCAQALNVSTTSGRIIDDEKTLSFFRIYLPAMWCSGVVSKLNCPWKTFDERKGAWTGHFYKTGLMQKPLHKCQGNVLASNHKFVIRWSIHCFVRWDHHCTAFLPADVYQMIYIYISVRWAVILLYLGYRNDVLWNAFFRCWAGDITYCTPPFAF